MKKVFSIFICFGLFPFLTYAQAPKFSNDFLNIGIGARAQAMSGSVVSNVEDITAGFWNPSRLTQIDVPFQVGVMHAEWFAGIGKYDYIGMGKKINAENESYGGLSIVRMAIDQIPNTLRLRDADGNINYDAIEEFSVADYAFLLSYGQRLGESPWRVGGNFKVIHRTIGSFAKAWGFGLDASISGVWNNWRFGAMLRDVTSTFNAWSFSFSDDEKQVLAQTDNEIPVNSIESTLPSAQIGVGYLFAINENIDILSELKLTMSTDGRESAIISSDRFVLDPSFGLEAGYKDLVFLRAGMGNLQNVTNDVDGLSTDFEFQPTVGLGLKLGRLKVDYAFTNIGEVSIVSSSHIFSVTLDFERKEPSN
jgi:hypothetical protein